MKYGGREHKDGPRVRLIITRWDTLSFRIFQLLCGEPKKKKERCSYNNWLPFKNEEINSSNLSLLHCDTYVLYSGRS